MRRLVCSTPFPFKRGSTFSDVRISHFTLEMISAYKVSQVLLCSTVLCSFWWKAKPCPDWYSRTLIQWFGQSAASSIQYNVDVTAFHISRFYCTIGGLVCPRLKFVPFPPQGPGWTEVPPLRGGAQETLRTTTELPAAVETLARPYYIMITACVLYIFPSRSPFIQSSCVCVFFVGVCRWRHNMQFF